MTTTTPPLTDSPPEYLVALNEQTFYYDRSPDLRIKVQAIGATALIHHEQACELIPSYLGYVVTGTVQARSSEEADQILKGFEEWRFPEGEWEIEEISADYDEDPSSGMVRLTFKKLVTSLLLPRSNGALDSHTDLETDTSEE